jgi:hypothetical protein
MGWLSWLQYDRLPRLQRGGFLSKDTGPDLFLWTCICPERITIWMLLLGAYFAWRARAAKTSEQRASATALAQLLLGWAALNIAVYILLSARLGRFNS